MKGARSIAITRDVTWRDLPGGEESCSRGTNSTSSALQEGREENHRAETDDEDESKSMDEDVSRH